MRLESQTLSATVAVFDCHVSNEGEMMMIRVTRAKNIMSNVRNDHIKDHLN